MEQEPTIKERIELFIQRLLDNGFVEQDEIDRCYQLLQKRYRIESLYELAKNYAQIEWRCIEFR